MSPFNRETDSYRRRAPATERNREPILSVLKRILPREGNILEIASGTGEHAVYFAPRIAPCTWLPSDPNPELRQSIKAWCDAASIENIAAPVEIDARENVWAPENDTDLQGSIRAVVCINMIHIAPWEACLGLMAGAARILGSGSTLYLYGPFKRHGTHTSKSNEAFDEQLKSQNPEWGVRDLETVETVAHSHGFSLQETVQMPANNLSVIFRKR